MSLSPPTPKRHQDSKPTSSLFRALKKMRKPVTLSLNTVSSRNGLHSQMVWIRFLLVLLVLVTMSIFTRSWIATTSADFDARSEAEEQADALAWNASLSVVVSHSAPLTCLDQIQHHRYTAGLGNTTVLRRTQLPSWTMHFVDAECTECLDSSTHAAAVARQVVNRTATKTDATVFATPSAPLGLIGPMLFAMASVTDDVAVGAELAKWSWVGRSYGMRRQFAGASPAGLKGGTTPYLVVMAIPSVDQPLRSTLRDAQRATWLSYTDVARSENDFVGALLPLYIFAAAEREMSLGVTDVSPLLPTVEEYEAASAMLLPHSKKAAMTVSNYTERRVQLVPNVRGMAAGDPRLPESPCEQIFSRSPARVSEMDTTWLSQLSSSLSLPTRPAAVAPAAFICHASTALWQEALAHRNMLWVDMMTDRRPTSGKKMGGSGNWGLPVEVGMTQKLVLWLQYAYHAFPDVPYIMKSDDDTYLKVPQFLRDVRYMRVNFKEDRMAAPSGTRDPPGIEEIEECVYWGGWMRNAALNRLPYHGGNGYMLHRRMVQAVMEDTDELNARTVRYAVSPFDPTWKDKYEDLTMNFEDMFVGRMLRDKRERLRELCPTNRAVFVEEKFERLQDSRFFVKVSWASVLVHRTTSFDEYYLHYYFQHEHQQREGQDQGTAGAVAEALAAAAYEYANSHVPSTELGAGVAPFINWRRPENIPLSFVSPADNVSVYSVEYETFPYRALDLSYHCALP